MAKYALLVGINYKLVPEYKLSGCATDVRNMRDFLIKHREFKPENIEILVDDDAADGSIYPTPVNFLNKLEWFVQKRTADDTLFFHYSGHGTQTFAISDSSEADLHDEAIVLETEDSVFLVKDTDLRRYFSLLPSDANLTCVFDCCHSHTMLDNTNHIIAPRNTPTPNHRTPLRSRSVDDSESSLGVDIDMDKESRKKRFLPPADIADHMSSQLGIRVQPDSRGLGEASLLLHGLLSGTLALRYFMDIVNSALEIKLAASKVLHIFMSNDVASKKSIVLRLIEKIQSRESFDPTKIVQALLSCCGKSTAGPGLAKGRGSLLSSLGSKAEAFWNFFSEVCLAKMNESDINQQAMLQSAKSRGLTSEEVDLANNFWSSVVQRADPMAGAEIPQIDIENHSGLMGDGGRDEDARDIGVVFTACLSDELASEVRFGDGSSGGIFTFFLLTYAKHRDYTNREILTNVRNQLQNYKFAQSPALTCGDERAETLFVR